MKELGRTLQKKEHRNDGEGGIHAGHADRNAANNGRLKRQQRDHSLP
jgi:hypothetical protein